MTVNATGTVRDPQPIDRLMTILKRVPYTDNQPVLKVWEKALELPDNIGSVWSGILELDQLVKQIAEQLQSHPSVEPDTSLQTLEALRRTYFVQSLEASFIQIRPTFESALSEMRFVRDIVNRLPSTEKLIPENEIKDLFDLLQEVKTQIKSDTSLSEDFQSALVKLANEMMNALKDYRKFGILPLERAMGNVFVQVVTNPTIQILQDQSQRNETTGKFMKAVGRFGQLVTAGNATVHLIEGVGHALKALGFM